MSKLIHSKKSANKADTSTFLRGASKGDVRGAEARAPLQTVDDYSPYDQDVHGKKWWTSDPVGEHILQTASKGLASYAHGIPAMTVIDMFKLAVERNGKKPAMKSELMPPLAKGETPPPAVPLVKWHTWTWEQYYRDCKSFAKACLAIGFKQHQSVNVFGFNSPEWAVALFGGMMAGGKGAGIYPSDNEEQVRFKTDHSDGVIAVVEDEKKLAKYRTIIESLPSLKAVVVWSGDCGADIVCEGKRVVRTFTFPEFLRFGANQTDVLLNERLPLIKPSHCCALIYTSGTTGNPKAVMISHDTLVFAVHSGVSQITTIGRTKAEERVLSYLPLSHVAGLVVELICPMAITSNIFFKGSGCTFFARSYDLKLGTLVNRLTTVKPTLFLGVPRVWEKMMEKLRAVGATSKGVKKILADFAKKRGAAFTSSRQLGETATTPMGMTLANVVLKKIRVKLGLDKCVFAFSGAAPMTRECLEYMGNLGINVNEVYGMSETCGLATWSTDDFHVWGSCGYESTGCEVKIFEVGTKREVFDSHDMMSPNEKEQGEICFRGRNIMMGYLANPRLGNAHLLEINQKNAEAIDTDGWLHSGDKGTRDKKGMFKITGRYKELIIGAGGENVAPVPIEDEIKRVCPFISNLMMVGNKRKFNVLLVTLKTKGSTGELPGTQELTGPAASLSTATTVAEAMKDDVFIKTIEKAIIATNKNLSIVPSSAAMIQKFTILPRDFSVLTGEFTATLKLKRQFVDDEFQPIIDKMFTVKDNYVNYLLAPTPGLDMGDSAPQPVEPDESGLPDMKNFTQEVEDDMQTVLENKGSAAADVDV